MKTAPIAWLSRIAFQQFHLNEPTQVRKPSRVQVAIWLLVLVVIWVLWLRSYGAFQVGVYLDDASYIVLARSLVTTDSYGLSHVPGQPLPTHWPFGFPLVLAPFVLLFPHDFQALTSVSLIATLLNVSLVFWGWPWLSRGTSHWWGLGVASLFGLSELGATQSVMSEPVFITFVLLALILVEFYLSTQHKRWWHLLLLGIVTTFTVYVRSIGIALFVAVCFRLVIMQPRKSIIKHIIGFSAGGVCLLAALVVLTPIGPQDLFPSTYVSAVVDLSPLESQTSASPRPNLLSRVITNAAEYARIHFRTTLIPIGGGDSEREIFVQIGVPFLSDLLGPLLTVLILLGCYSFLSDKGLSLPVLVYTSLYFLALCLWVWTLSGRFLSPIFPFLAYLLLRGIWYIVYAITKQVRRIQPNLRRLPDLVVVVSTLILSVLWFQRGLTVVFSRNYTRDFQAETLWLNQNLPSDAVIMAQQAPTIYLYSNFRPTVDFPRVTTVGELEDAIQTFGVDYLIVAPALVWRADGSLAYDDYTQDTLLPLLGELTASHRLNQVYGEEEEMVMVYQVVS